MNFHWLALTTAMMLIYTAAHDRDEDQILNAEVPSFHPIHKIVLVHGCARAG